MKETKDTIPEPLFRVDRLSSEQLEWIRETAASGRFLAPTGHWLAHQAHGLLKDVAWSQEAGPVVVLTCLDRRAAFVRQAYELASPNPPPCPEHGWELLEAAELLLKSDGWPESSGAGERKAAAQARLRECIEVLEPLSGPEDENVTKARKWLLELGAGAEALYHEPEPNVARGLKRPRSPGTA